MQSKLKCVLFIGSSVGVILPANVSEADRQHFEMLLESLTNLLHRQVSAKLVLCRLCLSFVSPCFALVFCVLL